MIFPSDVSTNQNEILSHEIININEIYMLSCDYRKLNEKKTFYNVIFNLNMWNNHQINITKINI